MLWDTTGPSEELTCEAIGISEQQSFFTAEYLSSLADGKIITTSWRDWFMFSRNMRRYESVRSSRKLTMRALETWIPICGPIFHIIPANSLAHRVSRGQWTIIQPIRSTYDNPISSSVTKTRRSSNLHTNYRKLRSTIAGQP